MTINKKKAWPLTFVLMAVLSMQLYAQFSGGSGTEADPYQVATAADLNNVRNYLSAYFIQTADIDLGVAPWNEGEGWVPIGDDTSNFTGSYSGNDFSITGLFINRIAVDYQGLFGVVHSAHIANVLLHNVSVRGHYESGSLIGRGRVNTLVNNCRSSGTVEGVNAIGGLMGWAGIDGSYQGMTVSNCSFIGDVSGIDYIGGLIGSMNRSTVTNCFSSGAVEGLNHIGGLIGLKHYSTSSNSMSSTTVTGTSIVGGLIGNDFESNTTIDCYSTGDVSGTDIVGGLVGSIEWYTGVTNCFSAGIVTGSTQCGGLIGRSIRNSGVSNSYWNTEITNLVWSAGGEGRTTDEMTYPYAANTYVGWDFDTIWHADPAHLNNGYPYLNEDWLAPTVNDLDAVLLSGDSTPAVNTSTTYSLSVKNRGSAAQSEYNVKLFGTGDVELGSVAGTPIAAGETLTFNIIWTPSSEGSATLYGKVILTGDENPYNDQTNQLQVNVLPSYTLYFNDFAASAGSEWSDTTITTAPNGGEKFLGRFANQAVTLSTNEIPPHNRVTIEFDLYVLDSWDADEIWNFNIDGNSLISTSFSAFVNQAYPDNIPASNPPRAGAAQVTEFGWNSGTWDDAIYHITRTIEHTGNSLQLSFAGSNLQGLDDESWGIDNILITYSDQPIPDFSVSAHSGQLPFTVSFTDASVQGLAPITTWAWDFDSNGSIDSNLQNPSWTYTQPGNYDVTLTVGDGTNTVTGTLENIIHVENSTLADGLVGYYPFSGNANDQSGRGNDGTAFNTVLTQDRYGRENMAYYFDGSAWISIPQTFMMHQPGDAAFSIWLTRKDGNDRGIFWTRNDGSDANRFLFNTRFGGIDLEYRAPDGTLHMHNGTPDASFPIETWGHIVVSRSGNTYKTYLNGVLVKTDVDSSPFLPDYSGSWWLGRFIGESAYGNIDDVRLYDRALNPSEIQRLYTMDSQSLEPLCRFSATPTSGVRPLQVQFTDESIPGLNPITSWAWDLNSDGQIESTLQNPSFIYPRPGTYTVTLTVSDGSYSKTLTKTDLIEVFLTDPTQVNPNNLSGYWPFNGNLEDNSSFNRDGSFVGSCSYVADRYGNANGAVANANSSSFISLPSFITNRNATTISVWYKATQPAIANGHYPIMSFFNNDIGTEYRIWQDNMSIGIELHYPGQGGYASGTTGIVTGTWYHLTSVFENGIMYFYVNGALINTTGYGGYYWHNAYPSEFLLGNYTFGNHDAPVIGIWDDLLVYDRALNQGQIMELFNANTDPSYVAIGISSPTIDSRWMVGSYQNIEWVIPDTYTNITLEYSSDNGDTWTEIARSVPANQYSYSWMVPDTPSETCKIRIKDRATPVVLYESEVFEINRPSAIEGIVAHYPLDANANDVSGNANHGTNYGAIPTEDRFGAANSAYSFDGNSYIHLDLQNGNMLDTVNTGAKTTVAFWMKWDGTNDVMVYGWYDYDLWFNAGYFGFNTGRGDIFSIPSSPLINNWVHIIAEFTNNQPYENKLYVNGVLQTLSMRLASPYSRAIRSEARIGTWLPGGYFYRGSVDDLTVINRSLNLGEVTNLYQSDTSNALAIIEPGAESSLITNSVQDIFWYADSSISSVDIEFSGDNGSTWQMLADDFPAQQYHYNWTVPDTVATNCKLRISANTGVSVIRLFSIINNTLDAGLIAYYPLDGNADDASGNGRHGTYQNVVPAADKYGVSTKAMYFPERNGWIDIPDVTSNVISASLWYKYTNHNANNNHILNPVGGNRHHIIINSQGYIGFYNGGFYISSYQLQVGNWYHLALLVEDTNYRLYVNGIAVYETGSMYLNSQYPLSIIGNYNTTDSNGSQGVYDDIRIYNRVITQDEVSYLYNNSAAIFLTGRITGSNAPDTGLGGVQVTLGENLMSTDTDGNGNFSFAGVSANSQYRLSLQKDGYATQDIYITVPNYNYDLGTITLYESANVPAAVMATQVPEASSASIDWSAAARSSLQAEAMEQGRAFLSYSLYRLLVGEEQNPAAWTLIATQTELSYSDAAWYSVPFGVYKYAVANNYSNGYQGVAVFSNELQRRNYTYSENFDHGGAIPAGWTVTHSGSTTHPWTLIQDSGADYSYKVMNTDLSTANEYLYSPAYNCSRYEKVNVSFWHSYIPNTNSQARFQYSTTGVTWTTLFTLTSTADTGIKTYDISTNAHHQAAVRFRWLYTATSYNTNSWTIDDFSVYGYTSIPVYLANPYPVTGRKVNSRTVELGISYTDDDMVNAASLFYRIDANGNGAYDAEEDWIAISGYSNAPQISVRVLAQFQTDGDNLRYEFRGADLAGGTVKHSGSNHALGIADDYSVDIDTVSPSLVGGFSIDAASFHSVSLSWLPVTEEHFAAYEIYYDTHRGVGLESNQWSITQDASLANINAGNTTINTLNSGVNYWFRMRAVDLHGNVSDLTEPLLYVSADLSPVISAPLPSGQPLPAWSNSRTVEIGCTFADYYGIDPASVQYRFDRNGNGVYDAAESWQNLPVRTTSTAALRAKNAASEKRKSITQMEDEELELYMRNRNILAVSVPVTYDVDGPELRFEFKATDVHGVGPVYTGFYEQAGIDDDWFVRVDSVNPTDIASIYIGVVNPSSIEVAWSRSSDSYFMTYEVYYATHPEVTTADLLWNWTNDPVLAYAGGDIVVTNVNGLTDNTMYYFRVRAIDEAGNASLLSNEVSAFYGTSSPPALPQNLQIQLQGDDVILSWDAVTDDANGNPITVTGYNIYASDLPDVVADIGYLIDASTTTSYTHLGIAPFVEKIFYIVTAVVEEEVRRFDKPNDMRLRTK